MKKIAFLFALVTLLACSNDDDNTIKTYKSNGEIKGIDLTECACCGGYIIVIENKTYRFQEEFPNKENLDLENLPIWVALDWELKKDDACENHITITAIKQIQLID